MLYRWYERSGDIDTGTKLAENELCALEHGSPLRN